MFRNLIAWWLLPKEEMVYEMGDYEDQKCEWVAATLTSNDWEWCENEATAEVNDAWYCGGHAGMLDPLS